MMHKLAIVSSTLLAIASGAPTALDTRQTSVTPTVENFVNALPVLNIQPINTRGAINWHGFSYGKTGGIQNAVIVPPASDTNVAVFGPLNVITIAQGGPAGMRLANSQYKSFALGSFYYGCSLNTQEVVLGVPTSCTITIKGYSDAAGTNLVATQAFGFTASKQGSITINSPMVKATLPTTFKGLSRVDFSLSAGLLGVAIAGEIDSVAYSVSK